MEVQSVRAIINVGDMVVKTPYVLNFNVTRQRGTIWASASASLEVPRGTDLDALYGAITITVVVDGISKLLFTGYVDKVDITPSRSRYSSVLVTLQAYDVLYRLRNLKINRRVQLEADKTWCAITGVVRKDTKDNIDLVKTPTHMVALNVLNGGYQSEFSTIDRDALGTESRDIGTVNQSSPEETKYIPAHTHSSFDEGGPAIGVFGDYKLYLDE